METSKNSTRQLTLDELIFSQEDSPANPTPSQESEWARKMNATCGPKCVESFGKFSRVGSWAKMFAALLVGMEGWSSKRCKLTWKLKGTKSHRLYFQLVPSVLPTEETEFGLLRTPAAQEPGIRAERLVTKDGEPARIGERAYDKHTGRLCQVGLQQQVQMGLLLTPTTREEVMDQEKFKARMEKYDNGRTIPNLATQVVGMLPTPKCQEERGNDSKDRGKFNLTDEVARIWKPPGKSSQLSPLFVEEMMGFPKNWTALPFQSGEENP